MSCRRSGFTLVETLVGLAIFGLVSAMLLVGVGGIGRTLARLGGAAAAIDDVSGAQFLVRMRLERLNVSAPADGSPSPYDVRGTASEITFQAPAPDGEQPIGLRRYRLRLSPAGDLILYSANALDGRAADVGIDGWRATRLLVGAEALSIAYVGHGETGRTRAWQSFWASAEVPQLVRIRLRFPSGDRRAWPDLIVRPGAIGSLACIADTSGTQCELAS